MSARRRKPVLWVGAVAAALSGLLAASVSHPFGGQNPAQTASFPIPCSGCDVPSWGAFPGSAEWASYRANWHHPDMSFDAARDAGFSVGAAASVAWHSDYIDSYLYNPLWWAAGAGPGRLIAALATQPHLANVHFDDLSSSDQVRAAWDRILGGTFAGLLWATEEGDVAAAHNVLGVSLHAIQDFYTHSNWIDDPARRETTWFDFGRDERGELDLWTGWYELQSHFGQKPHGKYGIGCTAMSQMPAQMLYLPACQHTPLGDVGTCAIWRECAEAGTVSAPNLSEQGVSVDVPPGVVFLAPLGVNVDNTWLAEIGRFTRGIDDIDGAELFSTAKGLAKDASRRWLSRLGELLEAAAGSDGASFWAQVRSSPTLSATHPPSSPALETHERQFEDFSQLAYTFLSAGPYPPSTEGPRAGKPASMKKGIQLREPDLESGGTPTLRRAPGLEAGKTQLKRRDGGSSAMELAKRGVNVDLTSTVASSSPPWVDGVHLRVLVETGSAIGDGTDADIQLDAIGPEGLCLDGRDPCRFELDHRVPDGTGLSSIQKDALSWNDFEPGAKAVYVVGPFAAVPQKIRFRNVAPSAQEIAQQAEADFYEAVEDGIDSARNLLLTLVSGHADFVKQGRVVFGGGENDDLPASGETVDFTIDVDGELEGHYEIRGKIAHVADLEGGSRKFRVEWRKLKCIEEAYSDQLPDLRDEHTSIQNPKSDEPFVFNMALPLGGEPKTQRDGPYANVDTGDVRDIEDGGDYDEVEVIVPMYGTLALVSHVWESDSETSNDRAELYTNFRSAMAGAQEEARSHHDFAAMLAEAVAAEWYLERLEVHAFQRSPEVRVGKVRSGSTEKWIRGGESATYTLDASGLASTLVWVEDLEIAPAASSSDSGAVLPVRANPELIRRRPPGATAPDAARDSGKKAPVRKKRPIERDVGLPGEEISKRPTPTPAAGRERKSIPKEEMLRR